jgi:salicylate hydroxylase
LTAGVQPAAGIDTNSLHELFTMRTRIRIAALQAVCVLASIEPLRAFLLSASLRRGPAPTAEAWRATAVRLPRLGGMRALRSANDAPMRPQKVAVIGGGPAGLATALALQKLPTGVKSVTVFERKANLRPGVGGGIQINGGAAILSKLGLRDEILAAGNPLERVLARNVDGTTLLDIQVPDLIRGLAPKPPVLRLIDMAAEARKQLVGDDGKISVFLIMRDKLQEMLAGSLPAGTVKFNKALTSVTETLDGQQVVCKFADGEEEAFDLVVGCDGVKSLVREQICGPDSAIYSGVRILFAVAPHSSGPGGSRAPEIQQQVHQWFGDGAYTFTASYGGPKGDKYDQIAIITADSQVTPENAEWTSSDRRSEMLRYANV